jgi:heat shock protein HtpX
MELAWHFRVTYFCGTLRLLGLRLLYLAGAGAGTRCHVCDAGFAFSTTGPAMTLALVPISQGVDAPRISVCGPMVLLEIHLPTRHPGIAVRCCIRADAANLSHLEERRLRRVAGRRHSGCLMVAMVLLLAICCWLIDGEEGVRQGITGATAKLREAFIVPETMLRHFGARRFYPGEMPALFEMLRDICRRANLPRPPDLYYIAAPHEMNAYALGGPERAAIALTEGLLRGMTLAEIRGILAHEVAHICNNDAWAMTWATALKQAIALTSLLALACVNERTSPATRGVTPLVGLLSRAGAIGQLLCLALSRSREFDADATALALIGDPLPLVAALRRLDRHHISSYIMAALSPQEGPERLLRTHPATCERVGALLSLAQ